MPRPVSKVEQLTVLLCAFLDVMLSIGLHQAYGVFFNEYLQNAHNPGKPFLLPKETEKRALLAFVGTLAAGLTWSGSIVINPVMARIQDMRILTACGAVALCLGYVLASFSTRVWHLLLTQGLLYGMGTSLLYFPVLAVAPEYFDAHRGSAMGFILSGAGLGGLVYAPTVRAMLGTLGARWTLRGIGLINFVIALPIVWFTPRPRIASRRHTLVNLRIARKPAFMLQALAAMSQAAGNFVPLTFLPEFSTTLGYTATFGATLLAVNNAVNTLSRIGMGVVADRVGRQNTLILGMFGSAVVVATFWLRSASSSGQTLWIVFVVTYGLFAGGYNSLFPTTVIEVFGTEAYPSINGFIYFVRGCGAFWGSPIGGVLAGGGDEPKSYSTLIWYDFGLLMLSSLCVLAVRGLDAVDRGQFKLKA